MIENRGSALVKTLVWLVVLGGIGGGSYYFWMRPTTVAQTYRTAVVERGSITQVVTATGSLNPVTNVQVGSQISGIITNLNIDFNSKVTNNQVIAMIDSGTYAAALHSAEADLASSQAALELAKLESSRSAAMLKDHLISTSDNDKTQVSLHQAEATVQIKRASLEKNRVDFERCTIYAPVDGVVISP